MSAVTIKPHIANVVNLSPLSLAKKSNQIVNYPQIASEIGVS